MYSVEIKDREGNVIGSVKVPDDIFNDHVLPISQIPDLKNRHKLIEGFNFYSKSDGMWIKVPAQQNLNNVLIFLRDFDQGVLKIQLF